MSFYSNIFLSQYCASKCFVWIRPSENDFYCSIISFGNVFIEHLLLLMPLYLFCLIDIHLRLYTLEFEIEGYGKMENSI